MFEDARALASFSVDDLAKAQEFYGETLGVKTSQENGILSLHLAAGASAIVYPKPNHTPANFTILNFLVDDIDAAVDQLESQSVATERYDGFGQDDRGIQRTDGAAIAWFKDPAGNLLGVIEEG